MSNRRHVSKAQLPIPGPGQRYLVVCAALGDRVTDHALVARAEKLTHDKAIADAGHHRRTGIWWTHHYARDARGRYDDITALAGGTADPQILRALDNPRSVLVAAWCVIATTTPVNGTPK